MKYVIVFAVVAALVGWACFFAGLLTMAISSYLIHHPVVLVATLITTLRTAYVWAEWKLVS